MLLLSRLYAAVEKVEDRAFAHDLLMLIMAGCENAADTLGDVSPDGKEYSDLAVRSLGGLLCERDIGVSSDAKKVRDWFFAEGVSF